MATLPGAPATAIIGFGKQSAAGTPVAATSYFPWEAISQFQPMSQTETYRDGTNREIVFDAKLGEVYQFDFTTQLRPSAVMQLLCYVLGSTDVSSHVTGTLAATTLSGASNTAGATSITVASTTGAAVGDVLLLTNVGGATLSEYVQVKTVTDSTHLALQTPLMNTYLASSTVAEANAAIYAHSGANANVSLPVLTFWHTIGNGGTGANPLDVVKIQDCVLSEFDMVADGAAHAKVNIKGMGKVGIPGQSNPTVAYETDRALTFADAVYNFTGVTITGGTSDITKAHFNIKNTIQQVPVHGTIVPQLYNAERTITADWDVFAEDAKPWRDVFWGGDTGTTYQNANPSASQVVLRYDLLSSPDHLVQFYLNNVVLQDAAPTFDVSAKPFKFTMKGTAKNSTAIGAGTPAFEYLALNGDTTGY